MTLPVSPDFDTYVVESFALGKPVVLAGGSVRVYPAARRQEAVSETLPLGPIWQATVAVAKLSPYFEACDSYCSAWQQACDLTANRDQCNVPCVAAPTLRPACADAFERNLRCARSAIVCAAIPPEADSAPSPCAAENAEYSACAGDAEEPAPTGSD